MDTIGRGTAAGAPPKRKVSAIRRKENILSLSLSGEKGGVKMSGHRRRGPKWKRFDDDVVVGG